jgi:hypothetical protein
VVSVGEGGVCVAVMSRSGNPAFRRLSRLRYHTPLAERVGGGLGFCSAGKGEMINGKNDANTISKFLKGFLIFDGKRF